MLLYCDDDARLWACDAISSSRQYQAPAHLEPWRGEATHALDKWCDGPILKWREGDAGGEERPAQLFKRCCRQIVAAY